MTFVRAERLKCRLDGNGSLDCGGGPKRFKILETTEGSFEIASDLNSASIEFIIDGHNFRAELVGYELTSDPVRWLPGTYGYDESCPEGTGSGSGLMRFTVASGYAFGTTLEEDDPYDNSIAGRYSLTTDCPPHGP